MLKNLGLILITTLVLLFKDNSTSAQSLELSLQTGIAIPFSDFSSTDLDNGSFTLTGFSTSAQLKYIKLKWGIHIQGSFQLNPIDVGMLGFERVKADPFLDDLYIRSDPFRIIEYSIGPLYKTQLTQKVQVEAQMNGGLMIASTPYQLHKPVYFMVGPDYYEITPSTDYTFTYGGGFSFQYDVTPCYSIGVTSRALLANAHFVFVSGQVERTDQRLIAVWNNLITLNIKLLN